LHRVNPTKQDKTNSASNKATRYRCAHLQLRRGGTTTATTTAAAAHTGALILNTTLLSVVSSGSNAAVLSRVDTKSDPSKDTIGDIVAKVDVLHEGVNGVGFFSENGVLGVGSEFLGVGGVGGNLLNGSDEVLVEEDLTNVRRAGGVQAGDGSVGENFGLVGWVG
jgi:hypothetical protein